MKNVQNLSFILQSILDENPHENLLCNNYFRIPKENKEFLKPYNNLQKNKGIILGKLLLFSTFAPFVILINLFISLIFTRMNKKFDLKITNTKTLFVSHATSSNLQNNIDNYFENIPNLYHENNIHVTILYLNHIKGNYSKNLKSLIKKKNGNTILLMPKFMETRNYLSFLKFEFKVVYDRIKLYYKYKKINELNSRIILNSIIGLMQRETYSNFHLLSKCKLIQNKSKIENLFLTLEGHAYEEQVIKQSLGLNCEIRIWVRQHSPISLAQTGVFNMLKSVNHQVIMLTTGIVYSELLKRYTGIAESFVIGTSKRRAPKNYLKGTNSILVAPEGTEKSTLDFLNFIYNLNIEFNIYEFIFRIHPDLISNRKITKQIRRNKEKSNFKLSQDSLEKDLSQTCFTLYRSSAVAIESLSFNNIPIYINFDGNLNLDVFSVLDKPFPTVSDISDQSSFLKILLNSNSNDIDLNVYDKLFQRLDISNLSEIFLKS